MLKAQVLDRRTLACPVCHSTEYDTRRRSPSKTTGFIINTCVCRRCASGFTFEEDKSGKPTGR